MSIFDLALVVVSIIGSFFLASLVMRRRILNQVKRMLVVMRADELSLELPADAFDESDSIFTDLERSAYSLRRKYLNLKRKAKDERFAFETVFSGLNEGIVTVDQNLRIISFNSTFMKFFAWSASDIQSKSIFLHDVIRDPDIVQMFKTNFIEKKLARLETERFKISVNSLPSIDELNSWTLGVFYDQSEAKNLEKIKVDLVANASHELRTPLTIIKGYSELLSKEIQNKSPELKAYINPILDGVHMLSSLTDDLANLAKIEQQQAVKTETIPTREITEDIVLELESLAELHDKKLICHYGANAVVAEDNSLRQVLRNLIVNAIRHSGKSGDELPSQEIHIIWETISGRTQLRIVDSGQGISPEHLERIFERFYRVDKGRNRMHGGSGLGLALVKHNMILMGGDAKVQSEVSKGTTFTCVFSK